MLLRAAKLLQTAPLFACQLKSRVFLQIYKGEARCVRCSIERAARGSTDPGILDAV